jgi:hypothetical protein
MLEDLRRYYTTSGISAENFRCPMAQNCRSVCADFISACEAFVGSDYQKGTLPRLLFISLDPARDLSDRTPGLRALAAVRRREEQAYRPAGGGAGFEKQRHWWKTYKFAYDMLSPVADAMHVGPIPFSEIRRYFAHTNSAKCKDAGKGSKQGRDVLFRNCRRFIPGEVAALKPDLIVTQGGYARDSIAGKFPVKATRSLPENPQYGYQVIEVNGRSVMKFDMAHPTAWGAAYQREIDAAGSWYMAVGHEFLLSCRA